VHIYVFRFTGKFVWSSDPYKQRWKEREVLMMWRNGLLFAHKADDAIIIHKRHVQEDQQLASSAGSFPRCL